MRTWQVIERGLVQTAFEIACFVAGAVAIGVVLIGAIVLLLLLA